MDAIKKAGVLGAGMMGSEIALCFAMAGIKVGMKDVSMDFAKGGMERAGKALDRLVKKELFDEGSREKTLALM
ncbi:MAG: 3-hydroxyacyl-CoA dehydrogenase family protein, partial [Deltaproteobacteria bacterium]|nr:3-hydroxyacyl-CoA dehydrogenase family protein [Deltaproteobacteria bacterium]